MSRRRLRGSSDYDLDGNNSSTLSVDPIPDRVLDNTMGSAIIEYYMNFG